MVRFLNEQDLERTNIDGETALCFAAKLGIVTIAKEMVKKNNRLPLIRSSEGRTPLYIAAFLGRRDMVSYLFTVTSFEGLDPSERMEILVAAITNDMYGMPRISIILSFRQLVKNLSTLSSNFDWAYLTIIKCIDFVDRYSTRNSKNRSETSSYIQRNDYCSTARLSQKTLCNWQQKSAITLEKMLLKLLLVLLQPKFPYLHGYNNISQVGVYISITLITI